jgi:hypothetical protein
MALAYLYDKNAESATILIELMGIKIAATMGVNMA